MNRPLRPRCLLAPAIVGLLLLAQGSLWADAALDRLRRDFARAESAAPGEDGLRHGIALRDRLERDRLLDEAADVALKVAFSADRIGKPPEAAAAALAAHRIVGIWRTGRMRPWDWVLQSKMSGMAAKNLMVQGRLAQASQQQVEAWNAARRGILAETGQNWMPDLPLPAGLSGEMLGVVLRNVRYDVELLSLSGGSVAGVARLRAWHDAHSATADAGGFYRNQLLHLLVGELKFLGYRKEALALQQQVIALAGPDSPVGRNALFNRAYWRSQWEGPQPEFLEEAKRIALSPDPAGRSGNRTQRRLLAMMAFDYQEAGFDVGSLADVAEEAGADGDEMESLSSRRDLAGIQRKQRDFGPAEANLLASLASARAMGRKRAEPSLYREYAILLQETGRSREAIRIAREAIRLTKSFGWIQHLPSCLHILANAQIAAGDTAGLRLTLAELQALLAAGKLVPNRALDAGVAIAICLHGLDQPDKSRDALQSALAAARSSGVPEWETGRAEKFPFHEIPPVTTPPAAATGVPLTDLQPAAIHSTVLPAESARVRFTLSNPSVRPAPGTLHVEAAHLAVDWQDASGIGRIDVLTTGGKAQSSHALTLGPGEEFLLTGRAAPGVTGDVGLRWEPAAGSSQQSSWTLTADAADGADVAVTNASLAGRNPFYALRLHHALHRRSGDPNTPVDLRITASHPIRIELLHPDTGELLAVDANGDGQLDGPGDVLLADSNRDGSPDLTCPAGQPAEIALLIYPLSPQEPGGETILDVQLRGPTGWEPAARNILK